MVLKGNFHFNKGPEGLDDAVEYYKKAIAIDSAYAYAHIGLGWAFYQQTLSGEYFSKIGFEMARKEIEKGLSLEVTAANKHSAHNTLAYINLWEYNWNDAKAEYEKAFAINPKRDDFNAFYHSFVLGKTADAISIFKKVSEENPLDVLNLRDFAVIQYLARKFSDAIQTCDKILELDPSFHEAYRIKGFVFSAEKKPDSALAYLKKAADLGNPWAPILTITTLSYIGKRQEARKIYSQVDSMAQGKTPAIAKALIYHSLGDRNKAFEWLERSYDEKDFYLATLRVDPIWDPLRGDPRFQRLMKKMNFPD
ncbi:MAG: tetratricopeptide repeat protein [Chitinophagaceae bacterium]